MIKSLLSGKNINCLSSKVTSRVHLKTINDENIKLEKKFRMETEDEVLDGSNL